MKISGKKRNGVLINPQHYELHAENYPKLKASDAEAALATVLPSQLPGAADDYEYIIRSRPLPGGGHRVVALILSRRNWEKLRNDNPGCVFIIPPAAALLRNETGFMVFEDPENPTKSFMMQLDDSTAHIVQENRIEQFSSNVTIGWNPDDPDARFFTASEELTGRRQTLIMILLLAFVTAALTFSGLRLSRMRSELELISGRTTLSTEELSRMQALKQKIVEEKILTSALQEASPISAYALLSGIIPQMPPGTQISSMVSKGKGFTIRGVSPDTLEMVRLLEALPETSNIRLQQLIPQSNGTTELFTLSGEYHGR